MEILSILNWGNVEIQCRAHSKIENQKSKISEKCKKKPALIKQV